MSALGPTLETPRLILRPPSAADFDAFAAFAADARTTKYLGGVLTRSMAWRAFATIVGAWTVNGHSMFSIVEKASGRWIGRGGPWVPADWPGTEVGWGLVADAQGQGYATEAATAAMDYAFDRLGWTEVVHCIDPANTPSIAVAKRLGSSLLRTGVVVPTPIVATLDIYGQTSAQWRQRRSGA